MRTPRQERSRRTLERILDASIDILAEHGWDAVTVGEVERRTGISRGAFYTRFPNRTSLLEYVGDQVILRVRHDQEAAFDRAAGSATDLATAVRAAVGAIAHVFSCHGQLLAQLSHKRYSTSGQQAVTSLRQRYSDLLAGWLRPDTDAVTAVAFSLRLVFDSLLARSRDFDPLPGQPPLSWDDHVDQLAQAVAGYLAPYCRSRAAS